MHGRHRAPTLPERALVWTVKAFEAIHDAVYEIGFAIPVYVLIIALLIMRG
jgi:hypothetical protein